MCLSLGLGLLTMHVGTSLREADNARIALLAEAESYATRSKLVRQIDTILDGLRDLHSYLDQHAPAPAGEWPLFQGLNGQQWGGIARVLWADDATGAILIWEPGVAGLSAIEGSDPLDVEGLRRDSDPARSEAMLGPYSYGNGHQFHVVVNGENGRGTLIVEIDSRQFFEALVRDESPGYAIGITWRGETLFQRGVPAARMPAEWHREGTIKSSMDTFLIVAHAPDETLAATLATPALSAILPLGLVISGLLGLLVFENGRVNVRAAAAARAQRQVASLNRHLEAQVAERTAELANRNADLVTITDSVAHDLRGPLNAISINIELLSQRAGGELDEECRAAIQRSTSGVRSMSEVIDRLIGLSTSAHSTFERERLSMRQLVAEVFAQLNATDAGPPVEFEVAALPDCEADETLVRILLVNLLGNALKYTRCRETRQIAVTSDRDNGVVAYCVTDNGHGLDPDQAARIFAPFEQLPEGRRSDGLGLGLAIAARVVERHGGRIWADGVKGQRASIWFTLEAHTTAPVAQAAGA